MTATIQTFLLLLAVLVVVAIAARRLKIAPSILLVTAGIALALVPGLPTIELAPEFVLLVVLPPLIYSAGVAMSWREFRFNLRPITLLAFGCVVFTTCAVALAVHTLLGLPWAVAFLLGAIVAPPDIVAPLALARELGLPRRILVVLEGEGLANDATALILYRFAVAAVSTGMFSLEAAAGTFAAIVAGEIAYGIGIGWLSLRLRRWAREPRVEITLSLMTPYLAYWVPEHLGGSGVLATVAAGLYVSWKGPLLIPPATRLQGIFFWDFLLYLIEGFVFLITGLQARALFDNANTFSFKELLVATMLTTAVIIVARFVWVFPATYLPRWLIPAVARRDPSPNWRGPFTISFIGVRGVVSLAAALAIPFLTAAGEPFPYRDMIIFITFGVIIMTLVVMGLLLPRVIHWLKLSTTVREERQSERAAELQARHGALDLALRQAEDLVRRRDLPDHIRDQLFARIHHQRQQLPKSLEDGVDAITLLTEIRLEMIEAERVYLHQLLRAGKITDESRRRIERELDLEEVSISSRVELPL